MKYYVVWKGRKPGIYTSWEACKKQVHKYSGAKYKSYLYKCEAEKAYGQKVNKKRPPVRKRRPLPKVVFPKFPSRK
jgi:ribonuclease HI